ncbi:MAG: hypothetical protein SPK76_04830 [Bacteroidales bacterium]|nr:hypothetical protein [Bacteroidales bacterium]
MKDFIKERLQYHLGRLNTLFDKNELAYLSSHCKNELQIRDRIAWQLHQDIVQKYGDLFVVRREWAPEEKNKSRVDLAILKMDRDKTFVEKVVALIEFKAHAIARPEPSYYGSEFQNDVMKMRDFKKDVDICAEADLFFVFLESGQNQKADKYESVLGFSKYQTPNCKYCRDVHDEDYLREIESHWQEFKKRLPEAEIHAPNAIEIGEAFGYKQYVSPLLIGPLE